MRIVFNVEGSDRREVEVTDNLKVEEIITVVASLARDYYVPLSGVDMRIVED